MVRCKEIRETPSQREIRLFPWEMTLFQLLEKGHMGKFCEEKLNCEVGSSTHPSALHIKSKDKAAPKEEPS